MKSPFPPDVSSRPYVNVDGRLVEEWSYGVKSVPTELPPIRPGMIRTSITADQMEDGSWWVIIIDLEIVEENKNEV